jgi:GTP cyclohydrolase I
MQATRDLLVGLGYKPKDEELRDTPQRVARAWKELLSGVTQDPQKILGTTFAARDYDEIVLLKNIAFYSMCEHHLLPFHGVAHVAYLPNGKRGRVAGLSKLARLVEMHARRLQLQERMTSSIARDLSRVLKTRGTAVVVQASHMCMCARGVSKPGATMMTSTMLGSFRRGASARAEVLALLGLS